MELNIKTSKKKKLEYHQKMLIVMTITSIIFTTLSYVLSFFDKNPIEELSKTIIQTLWGTTGVGLGSYSIVNCVRAFTGSKWGVPLLSNNESNNPHKEEDYRDER